MKEEVIEAVEMEDKQVEPIVELVPEESHEESREESREELREKSREESHQPIPEPKEATPSVEAEAPQPANKSKKHYPNRRRGANDVESSCLSLRRNIVLTSLMAEGIR